MDIFEAIEQAAQNAQRAAPVSESPAEPDSGPVIKPVLIGSADAAVAERKKGWWRR